MKGFVLDIERGRENMDRGERRVRRKRKKETVREREVDR